MVKLAPIVLFVYNRPFQTRQALEALSRNELANESVLFVYSDGPKEGASEEEIRKISEVRGVVQEKKWCKEVHLLSSDINKGLANSVIDGVAKIVNEYGSVIVLEDDLITSKGFVNYMNRALEKYMMDEQIMQVSGYCFPTKNIHKNNSSFFIPMTTSWGWATWKRAWDKFDPEAKGYDLLKADKGMEKKFNLDGAYPYSSMLYSQLETRTVDSWAIRWWWSVFKENGLSLFPDKSLVKNIGFGDKSATHTQAGDPFPLSDFDADYVISYFPDKIVVAHEYFSEIKTYIYNSLSHSGSLKSKEGSNFLSKLFNKIFK